MKTEELFELRGNIKSFFNLEFDRERRFQYKFNGLRELLLNYNY